MNRDPVVIRNQNLSTVAPLGNPDVGWFHLCMCQIPVVGRVPAVFFPRKSSWNLDPKEAGAEKLCKLLDHEDRVGSSAADPRAWNVSGMCLENSWDMGPTAQLAMWVLTASEAKGLQRPADLVRRRMQGVCGVRIRLCRYNPMDAITASSHSCPMLQWSWALDFPKLGFPGFC